MTDEIGGGISLGEAFRRSISKTRWEKFKALEAYKAPKNRLSDPPPEYEIYQNRYHQLFATLWGPLKQRLCSGELIATAYEGAYTGLHCQREVIPAEVWEFAEPDFEKSEASAGILPFTRIKIFRASEVQIMAPPGDTALHQQLSDQRSVKDQVQLSPDGRKLTIGSVEMIFSGRKQIIIITELVKAYREGRHLLTQELLQRAKSDSKTIEDVFKGGPNWAKLSPFLRQDNRCCWLEV